MRASIIIPVWNGASVIVRCLDALLPQLSPRDEVICIDNASPDDSAVLIEKYNSRVYLIRQPVNLGFAGAINAGMQVTRGDILILLNQDCIVQPGWLDTLSDGLLERSGIGIAGCRILNPDGTPNHVGARIRRPDAYGVHLTKVDELARGLEYVTGAAFAIRREVLETIGDFDEGFYPAYYEDADYCYRARQHGYEIACILDAEAIHLCSSQEWQADTFKYAGNHHRSRYRFVCKHFTPEELDAFFAAEQAALQTERYFDHTIGRALAARDILRGLSDILTRRTVDLGGVVSTTHHRHLERGFTSIFREAFTVAKRQFQSSSAPLPSVPSYSFPAVDLEDSSLVERERALWACLIDAPVTDNPSIMYKITRLLKRVTRTLSGEEARLLAELHVVQTERLAHVYKMNQRSIDLMVQTLQQQHHCFKELCDACLTQAEQRIKLLEMLVEYDYR